MISFPIHVWQDLAGLLPRYWFLPYKLPSRWPVYFFCLTGPGDYSPHRTPDECFCPGDTNKNYSWRYDYYRCASPYAVSLRFLFRQIFDTVDLMIQSYLKQGNKTLLD